MLRVTKYAHDKRSGNLEQLCSTTITLLDMAHICASNISSLFLRLTFRISQLFSGFQTIATPVILWFGLDSSHPRVRLTWSFFSFSMALHLSSIKNFPQKYCTNISAIIGSTPSPRSMLYPTKICLARHCPQILIY